MLRLVTALTVAALFAVPSAHAASGYKDCSGGFNPDGTAGTFYHQIEVKRITCAAGKKVVKDWVIQAEDSRIAPTATRKVLGYTCKGKATGGGDDDPDGGIRVTCKKDGGKKAVRFFGHP
ncbi:MAG: hypothetical protein JHC95_21560 [Solirubrobacteraceae bacterium]|nr:hypothetical protein [Solirubrobacteraceae bacterium]